MFDESVAVRFWAKVNKDGPIMPHMDTPCWTWTASKNGNGYGQLILKSKRTISAHRLAYTLEYGEIPGEMHICHHCDNPSCVRAGHLYLGTPQDNANDRKARGHRLDPEVRKAHDAEAKKKYYEENREFISDYNKQYREQNRESEKERKRIWYENNRERVRQHQKEYQENVVMRPEKPVSIRLKISGALRNEIQRACSPDVSIDEAIMRLVEEGLRTMRSAA